MGRILIEFGAPGLSHSTLCGLGERLSSITERYATLWFDSSYNSILFKIDQYKHCFFTITGLGHSMIRTDSFAREIISAFANYGIRLDYDTELGWMHD